MCNQGTRRNPIWGPVVVTAVTLIGLAACKSTGVQVRIEQPAALNAGLTPAAMHDTQGGAVAPGLTPDKTFMAPGQPMETRRQYAAAEPEEDRTPAPPQVPVDSGQPIVRLDTYEVTAEPPKLAFGLALQVWPTGFDGKVGSIVVSRVKINSDAEREGLIPGTMIERVNGRDVREFDATFRAGSDLHAYFINRRKGSRIELHVRLPSAEARTVVLTERLNENPADDLLSRLKSGDFKH